MARLPLPRQGAPAWAWGLPAWDACRHDTNTSACLGLPACLPCVPLSHRPTGPHPAHAHPLPHTQTRCSAFLSPPAPPCPPLQVLKDIPLYVVTEEKIGLLGTREQAIRIAEELRAETAIAT